MTRLVACNHKPHSVLPANWEMEHSENSGPLLQTHLIVPMPWAIYMRDPEALLDAIAHGQSTWR